MAVTASGGGHRRGLQGTLPVGERHRHVREGGQDHRHQKGENTNYGGMTVVTRSVAYVMFRLASLIRILVLSLYSHRITMRRPVNHVQHMILKVDLVKNVFMYLIKILHNKVHKVMS